MNTILEKDILVRSNVLQPEDLEYISYSGQHDLAHGIFRSLDRAVQRSYLNRYVFQSVMLGGINKLRKYLASSAEEEAHEEKELLDRTMYEFLTFSQSVRVYPRELFESTLLWCEELSRLSLLTEAIRLYDETLGTDPLRYPDLYVRLQYGKADVLAKMGRLHEAEILLRRLVERPYLLTDRNFVPKVVFALGKVCALRGDLASSMALTFQGLRLFYTDIDQRGAFFEQIIKAYRRSYRVLVDPRRKFTEKFLFTFHWLYFRVDRNPLFRLLQIHRGFRLLLLGSLYYLNFVLRRKPWPLRSLSQVKTDSGYFAKRTNGRRYRVTVDSARNILVTRAMGGIGDLLMMTPGLHELKKKHPTREIHLAIPHRYFSVFKNNPDVVTVDINEYPIEPLNYWRWFNLSDCPAARRESRTAPRVRQNRVEIFARALGVGRLSVSIADKKPRYVVSAEERALQERFWVHHNLNGKTVIGVQLHAEESYRDYPHMAQLVRTLAQRYEVLVFDDSKITESFGPRAIPVCGMEMREAFAIASGCDAIICPDSAFVHLAAALDIPCVALYGPIDGAIRTKDYPKCMYLDVRNELPCVPCWRNESIPCRLTDMRMSVCMANIPIARIQRALEQVLKGEFHW